MIKSFRTFELYHTPNVFIFFVISMDDMDWTFDRIEDKCGVRPSYSFDFERNYKVNYNQPYVCISRKIEEWGFNPIVNFGIWDSDNTLDEKYFDGRLIFSEAVYGQTYDFSGYIGTTKEEVDDYVNTMRKSGKYNI